MEKVVSKYRQTSEGDVLSFITETVRLISGTGIKSACMLTTDKSGHITIYGSNVDGQELTAYAVRLQQEAMIETMRECDFLRK